MAKIFVAGHKGMVGGAILRQLRNRGTDEIVTRSSKELDLTDQSAVHEFMQTEKPDVVILAAAKVGGIIANSTYPADFIRDNLMIECNVIHESHLANVQKIMQLGSSCIYPREATLPIKEEYLLTGKLEPTNEPYAIAKIAGIKICESYNRQFGRDYRSIMPTNLYGPGDNFHPQNSHVLPALIRRFHEAKCTGKSEVTVWGSGKPMREFLHVDDMATATLFVMDLDEATYQKETQAMCSHVNVGSGIDVSIRDLAELVSDVIGFSGKISFDSSKPDGTFRKVMDISRLSRLGWCSSISLREGIEDTYKWFLEQPEAELRSK